MADPFDTIQSQPMAIGFLRRALSADRMPHGLLFAGPAGVGKRTTALALAAVWLDAPLASIEGHADVHLIGREMIRHIQGKEKNKAIDFSIDVIRQFVNEPAGHRSVSGAGKVFILKEVDTMNAASQNALLKTLEEPYGRTLIILLSNSAEAMLPTIRSRCQLVRFGPVEEAVVMSMLCEHGIDAATAKAAAALAGGSIGQALRWAQDGVVARSAELDKVRRNPADLADWLKASAEAWAEKQLARDPLASKDAATRAGYALWLNLLGEVERCELTRDAAWSAASRIDALANAERLLDGNVNTQLVLQQLSMRM